MLHTAGFENYRGCGGDPQRTSIQDYDHRKPPDGSTGLHRRYKTEICRHFSKGFCKLGQSCNFAHGDLELAPGVGRAGSSLSRERSRDRGSSALSDKRRRVTAASSYMVFHIDELEMPKRPEVQPAASDREVYVDPMPDKEFLDSCLNAFGDVEGVFHITDSSAGGKYKRGYVRFKEHAAAKRCVEAEFGTWSESERVLASAKCRRPDSSVSAYPDNVIALFVGHGGGDIRKLEQECRVSRLHLRGPDAVRLDKRFPPLQNVHFVAEGEDLDPKRIKATLQRRLAEIHETMQDRGRRDRREDRAKDGGRGFPDSTAQQHLPIVSASPCGFPAAPLHHVEDGSQPPPPAHYVDPAAAWYPWGPPPPAAYAAAWGFLPHPPPEAAYWQWMQQGPQQGPAEDGSHEQERHRRRKRHHRRRRRSRSRSRCRDRGGSRSRSRRGGGRDRRAPSSSSGSSLPRGVSSPTKAAAQEAGADSRQPKEAVAHPDGPSACSDDE